MRVLAVNDEVRAAIRDLIERSLANPISLDDVMTLSLGVPQGGNVKLSDRPDFKPRQDSFITIPFGFTVCLCYEQQPIGLCRHLSISVEGEPGMLPHPEAVWMIAAEFGFKEGQPRKMWLEEYEPGREAVNILELVTAATTAVESVQ